MRYQLQSDKGGLTFRPKLFTEAIKILIGVNTGVFFLQYITRGELDLTRIFGLSPDTIWPLIWQPVTYMFVHGGFFHILINMFVLWMFGSEMESIWGQKAFLKYYFLTGVGSGLVWLLFNLGNPNTVLIGASGAVYGILLAYGMMFPNRLVYLYFIVPIKVKWFVIFLGVVAFFSSLGSGSNISHITHLSGMVIGYIYLKYYWRWKDVRFSIHKQVEEIKSVYKDRKLSQRRKLEQEVDQILDKINEVGYDGLTEAEKDRLYQASERLSRYRKKD